MGEPGTRTISNNETLHRYEIAIDGRRAGIAAYRLEGQTVVFTHTQVEPAFAGQGVGSALARGALDEVRARRLNVIAQCPFIAGWINTHPEYADLLRSG